MEGIPKPGTGVVGFVCGVAITILGGVPFLLSVDQVNRIAFGVLGIVALVVGGLVARYGEDLLSIIFKAASGFPRW